MSIKDFLLAQGVPEQRGDEWEFSCPDPNHLDSRPSASIYVGDPTVHGNGRPRLPGMWVCYSCDSHGRLGSLSVFEPTTDEVLDSVDADLNRITTPEITYPESWLSLFDGDVHPYWRSRFTDEAIRHFRLGFDYDSQRLTYPLRNWKGQVLGVVRRKLPGQSGPKYRYPSGVTIGQQLFNFSGLPDRLGTLAVVEGAADVIALWEVGVQAVAIFGSRLSDEQVRLLRRLNPVSVCLAFDVDSAGRRAVEKALHSSLDALVLTVADWDPRRGKDVGELDLRARREVIENSTVWMG